MNDRPAYAAHCVTVDGYGPHGIDVYRTELVRDDEDGGPVQYDVADHEPVATFTHEGPDLAKLDAALADNGWRRTEDWQDAEAGPVAAVERR